MNLQARRIGGSTFSAEDVLEVILDTDNQALATAIHTIELVSGVNVTHGGGGQPDEYLHYKAVERDADGDGIIDYSNITMNLIQDEKGTSVIKVKCKTYTQESVDAYNTAFQEWINTPESDDKGSEPLPPEFTVLSTKEITLEWTDDAFM